MRTVLGKQNEISNFNVVKEENKKKIQPYRTIRMGRVEKKVGGYKNNNWNRKQYKNRNKHPMGGGERTRY